MPVTLSFHETHRYNFPVWPTGGDTALTVCRVGGDPMLAFLTQSQQDDEVVYLSLGFDHEIFRHVTPPGRHFVTGMGFNRLTNKIWCGSSTNQRYEIFSFDPATGQEVFDLTIANSNLNLPGGFATNGLFFVQSDGSRIELRTMGGVKLGQRVYAGRSIRGITESPGSWTFIDQLANEIVIIGPLGGIIATAPAPGTAAGGGLGVGPQSIAFDTISDMQYHPQVWLEPGIIGDPGTIHHPDTPWDPEPWPYRHRLYVANQTDRIIYAGYLTEF